MKSMKPKHLTSTEYVKLRNLLLVVAVLIAATLGILRKSDSDQRHRDALARAQQEAAQQYRDAHDDWRTCLQGNNSREEIKGEIQFVLKEFHAPEDTLNKLRARQDENLPQRECGAEPELEDFPKEPTLP